MRIMGEAAAIMAATAVLAGTASAEVRRTPFGQLPDGQAVEAITLANTRQMSVTVLTYGATLQSVRVPDRRGRVDDVLLGFDDLKGYESGGAFFGATVGRVANRIAGGTFTLDGHTYTMPTFHGHPANLHGGVKGFDKLVWTVEAVKDGPAPSVTLALVSPDGDQGFPGTLHARAIYTLGADNQLSVTYEATTDKPTVVNLTNHAYWNLAGAGGAHSAMEAVLTLHASHYTPVADARLTPSGEIVSVANTPFDFRTPHTVAERVRDPDPQLRFGHGYDINMVLDGAPGSLRPAAHLVDPSSGRTMDLLTDQPGLQLYSGNGLNGAPGKGGLAYRQGDGLAMEVEAFPDAVNHPNFPSTRLDPGQTYRNHIVWRFGVAP
jgi:aldose 1-epimerase